MYLSSLSLAHTYRGGYNYFAALQIIFFVLFPCQAIKYPYLYLALRRCGIRKFWWEKSPFFNYCNAMHCINQENARKKGVTMLVKKKIDCWKSEDFQNLHFQSRKTGFWDLCHYFLGCIQFISITWTILSKVSYLCMYWRLIYSPVSRKNPPGGSQRLSKVPSF